MCDRNAAAPRGCWANGQCYGDGPYSLNITWNYQNAEIHPRVKHVIGERLARALLALQQGQPQPTPKLAGCRLESATKRLVLSFDEALLNGEAVGLQAPGPGLVPLEFRVGAPTNASTGWVYADSLEPINRTSIAAVLPPGVGTPSAVRYAFGELLLSVPAAVQLPASRQHQHGTLVPPPVPPHTQVTTRAARS